MLSVWIRQRVDPGVTEEECISSLERHSGLKWKQDLSVGGSPERNTFGDTASTVAGIVQAAEAAHLNENAQRDLHIDLRHEPGLSSGRVGIDRLEVLKAAGIQWIFYPFVAAWRAVTCKSFFPAAVSRIE